jgi:hypothetical protein
MTTELKPMPDEQVLWSLLDELKLNMTVKRHQGGNFDARIYHPWMGNPILSSCSKSSYQDCINEFLTRLHAIENARSGIEKKNKARAKRAEQESGNPTRDAEEYSQWNDWI